MLGAASVLPCRHQGQPPPAVIIATTALPQSHHPLVTHNSDPCVARAGAGQRAARQLPCPFDCLRSAGIRKRTHARVRILGWGTVATAVRPAVRRVRLALASRWLGGSCLEDYPFNRACPAIPRECSCQPCHRRSPPIRYSLLLPVGSGQSATARPTL